MTTKILTQSQAKAAYSAMCALNNVGGRVISKIEERGRHAIGNPPVEVVEGDFGEIRIGFRIISGQSPIVVEQYQDQAAFSAAYGLQ